MAMIDLIDGATVAQLNEAERIQHRKGGCLIRLGPGRGYDDRMLMHVDVLGDRPGCAPGGQPLPYMTITLLPSGRPIDVTVHDIDELMMKQLDDAVLALLSTDRNRWWTVEQLAAELGASRERVRDAGDRLVGLSMVQWRGVRARAFRHAEAWL